MKRITRLVLLTSILFSAVFLQPPQVVRAASFPAQMNKSFTPISIVAGSISVLSVTIYNPNSFPLTSAHYHDFFPAGIYVSSPVTVTNNCGGTITNAANAALTAGDTSFQLNGGTVPPQSGGNPGECTVTVAVTSITPGNLINTIPAQELYAEGLDGGVPVDPSELSNTTPASATLQVAPVLAPSLSKNFNPVTVWVGQSSQLEINITNNDPITTLTETTLTDSFPPTFSISAPLTSSLLNCGPSATLTGPGGVPLAVGQSSVTLNNASIAPLATCRIRVRIVSPVSEVYRNSIPPGPLGVGSISTRQGVTNAAEAYADIYVQDVGISKTFLPTTIQQTDSSLLSINIQNPTGSAYTGIGLDDVLPNNLTYVPGTEGTNNCGPGTATLSGAPINTLSLANATIPAGSIINPGVCTFFARVTGSINGTYTNRILARTMTGPVTNVREATAVLTVQTRVIGLSKTFSPASINPGGTSNLTIVLQNGTSSAYTGVGLLDTLPVGLTFVFGSAAVSATCAPATVSINPALTQLTLSNATIPAGVVVPPGTTITPGTCTITAQVTSSTVGSYTNNIPPGSVTGIPGISNGNTNSNQITVSDTIPVGLTKSFQTNPIGVGGNTRLRLAITAPADIPLTSFSITDTLPTGVTVSNSTGPNFSPGCGLASNRTLTAPTGATSINLLLNTFAAGATCNLDVWVTSSTPGTAR